MKKHIILFGAGKSATCLIGYLIKQCVANEWQLIVADSNLQLAESKTGVTSNAEAVGMQVEDAEQRANLIQKGDIVISLLPPGLHFLVAVDCLHFGKNLLTASYMDENISGLEAQIKNKNLLFLCEMGLDPGIDHMSAMKLIHAIKKDGGTITSFNSHCGGLVAPESDDNPWHYKISWNPRNIVMAGSAGAVYKQDNQLKEKKYEELYENCDQLNITGLGKLAYYPNRNSLSYVPVYKLEEAETFIRTTLRHAAFCNGWDAIVKAQLTNGLKALNAKGLTFKTWSESIIPFINKTNREQLQFLGLFDEGLVPSEAGTSADILQHLLEKKLVMQTHDKDMVVMLHNIAFELNSREVNVESLLIVKGNDSMDTAMAKTVGLPLGIASKLILQGKIKLTGLHIPILPEIYEPVLKELEAEGIKFNEQISKLAN